MWAKKEYSAYGTVAHCRFICSNGLICIAMEKSFVMLFCRVFGKCLALHRILPFGCVAQQVIRLHCSCSPHWLMVNSEHDQEKGMNLVFCIILHLLNIVC